MTLCERFIMINFLVLKPGETQLRVLLENSQYYPVAVLLTIMERTVNNSNVLLTIFFLLLLVHTKYLYSIYTIAFQQH